MSREWARAERILCVRLDTVGDVLMTTPAIRALALGGPDSRRVSLLTSSKGAEAARLVPEVAEAIVYDAPWMKGPRESPEDSSADLEMVERLRERRFDAAVVFTVYSQTPHPAAMLCYLAGIPLRLAYTREKTYRLLTHPAEETEPERGIRHEVQRHLELVGRVGAATGERGLSMSVGDGALARARSLVARGSAASRARGYFVVHPGASAPSRRWPARRFGSAAARIARRRDLVPVFTGGPGELSLAEEARAEAGMGQVLAGIDLETLAAVIGGARLIITNNTGPAHVAAAVGTPVVDLYALTNPQHSPWQVPSRVLSHQADCAYCYSSRCLSGLHECLEGVGVEQVVQAAEELLGAEGARELRA